MFEKTVTESIDQLEDIVEELKGALADKWPNMAAVLESEGVNYECPMDIHVLCDHARNFPSAECVACEVRFQTIEERRRMFNA